MYKNISDKLKTGAKLVGIGGLIICILGLISVAILSELNIIIFVKFIIGAISCVIISWLIYGFSELIEKIDTINVQLSNKLNKNNEMKFTNQSANSQVINNDSNLNIKNSSNNIDKRDDKITSFNQVNTNNENLHSWRCSGCGEMVNDLTKDSCSCYKK